MTRKPETFFEEMKRYVDFGQEDARLLEAVGARMDPYLPAMSERFYDQITHHPDAGKVFSGGQEQIDRLNQLKSRRDNPKVQECLNAIKSAAKSDKNLMPLIISAVEQYATLGEIADAMREVFGEHRA